MRLKRQHSHKYVPMAISLTLERLLAQVALLATVAPTKQDVIISFALPEVPTSSVMVPVNLVLPVVSAQSPSLATEKMVMLAQLEPLLLKVAMTARLPSLAGLRTLRNMLPNA